MQLLVATQAQRRLGLVFGHDFVAVPAPLLPLQLQQLLPLPRPPPLLLLVRRPCLLRRLTTLHPPRHPRDCTHADMDLACLAMEQPGLGRGQGRGVDTADGKTKPPSTRR